MAVLGRLLFASAERLDLPDLLSIDSFAAGDFKFLLKGLIGEDKPIILRGFDVINPAGAIGNKSLSITVAESVVLFPGSLAGPFFHGLEAGNANATPLVPELKKNATNFVYLTLSTFDTARDTRAFWDPDLEGGDGGEFSQDIDTESVIQVEVNVSVSAFPVNTVPVCIAVVGPSVIESIEDARTTMWRLGSGGLNPDPFSRFDFDEDPAAIYARKEPPNTISSSVDPNPFQGGDKNIDNLKEWMDVVMTKLLELSGTTYWYEDTSTFGMVNLFLDSLGRSLKSKGQWSHSDATPGLLAWTEDIHFKYASDDRDIIIRAASKTLANEEVMYVELARETAINTSSTSVNWFNALDHVNGVTGSFESLKKGDWVKKKGDPNRNHRRVEEFFAADALGGGATSPALARSIRLSNTYAGTSETQQGEFTKGSYDSSEVFVIARSAADGANGGQFLEDLGGDLAWLALRSDTIMNVSDITTTTLALVDITEADGSTAKVTSTGHGLVDGDRVTVADSAAGYNGTFVVDVVDADNFYIDTADFGDETGVANVYYATVTTVARSIPGGFEVESAQHSFEDGQTIEVAGTASAFDDTYLIKARTATTFTIPVPSGIANVTTSTATLSRVNVRSEFGIVELKQGEGAGIGEGDTDNIMSFIGMASIAETNPTYNLPSGYNTLDGTANYNGETTDSLTTRTAKLTGMMADKAQDKTIKLALEDTDRVTNTQNVGAQDVTFTSLAGATPTMNVILPNSAANGSVTLSGTLSLNADQAAYFTIDRNATFTVASLAALTVADIDSVPLDENIFIFAVRLAGQEVWLWDATLVEDAETRAVSSHSDEIDRQDRNLKLIKGGTWAWDDGTDALTNSADAYIQIPGLSEVRNTILAQTITLAADGDVAFVQINRNTGGADNLTVSTGAIASVDPTLDTLIIARRENNDILLGTGTDRLVDGQSQALDATSSDQTTAYNGQTDTADSDPAYSSTDTITQGNDLTTAIGDLDARLLLQGTQDRNAKLVRGGTFTWNSGTGNLSFTTDAFIQLPNITEVRNTIQQSSQSPINLASDGDIAYVRVNRVAGGATNLTVVVEPIDAITGTLSDVVVIARRIGTDLLLGNGTLLLKNGENTELDRAMPLSTAGDIIYRDASNATSRLPIGAATEVLTVSGGEPSWQAASVSDGLISVTLDEDVAAEDVIAFVDDAGTKGQKNALMIPDTETTYESGDLEHTSIAEIGPDKFVIGFIDITDSNKPKVVVGTKIGHIISVVLDSAIDVGATASERVSVAKLDTDKFVVSFDESSDGRVRIGTVAGVVISFPTASVSFDAGVGADHAGRVRGLGIDKFAIAWVNGTTKLIVATVAATVPTFGAIFDTTLGTFGTIATKGTDTILFGRHDTTPGDSILQVYEVIGSTVQAALQPEIKFTSERLGGVMGLDFLPDSDRFVLAWVENTAATFEVQTGYVSDFRPFVEFDSQVRFDSGVGNSNTQISLRGIRKNQFVISFIEGVAGDLSVFFGEVDNDGQFTLTIDTKIKVDTGATEAIPNDSNEHIAAFGDSYVVIYIEGTTGKIAAGLIAQSCAIMQEAGLEGETKMAKALGGISTVHAGQTIGAKQFLQFDGTIGETRQFEQLGSAKSATDLLVHPNAVDENTPETLPKRNTGVVDVKSNISASFPLNTAGYIQNEWMLLVNNSLLLTPGIWRLNGSWQMSSGSTSNGGFNWHWGEANGANTTTEPDPVGTTAADAEVLGGVTTGGNNGVTGAYDAVAGDLIVKIKQTSTVFFNAKIAVLGSTAGQVIASLTAVRLGDWES